MQVLTAERRQAILAWVERDGRVVASELVANLGVSEDTVRRDLRDLAERGLLYRVHGGALASAPPTSSFTHRLEVSHEEKAALAEAALPLVVGARVIVFDGGTTSWSWPAACRCATRAPSSPTRHRLRWRSRTTRAPRSCSSGAGC